MESCGSKGDAHLKKDSSNTAWREGWRTGKSIASVAQRMMMVRGCWPVICVVCGTTLDVRGLKMPMHYLPSSIVSDALNFTFFVAAYMHFLPILHNFHVLVHSQQSVNVFHVLVTGLPLS